MKTRNRLSLTPEQNSQLTERYRTESTHENRIRFKIVELYNMGKNKTEIATLLGCHRNSVLNTIKRFKENGIEGLRSNARSGRPRKLDDSDMEIIKASLKTSPMDLKSAIRVMKQTTGKEACDKTIRNFLKLAAQDLDV